MAKDPVCGMYVEESENALKTQRRGTTFYFCSETCLIQFEAPEKALRRLKLLVVLGGILAIPIVALTYLPIILAPIIYAILWVFIVKPLNHLLNVQEN